MYYTDYLEHHGVKGMKWGVRRYQNEDGTLTSAGKEKLKNYKFKESNKVRKRYKAFKDSDAAYRARKKKQGVLISDKRKKRVAEKMDRYQRELQAISKMKYKDMQKEKLVVGYNWIGDMALSLSAMPVMAAIGSPISPIFVPRTANIKQQLRLKERRF